MSQPAREFIVKIIELSLWSSDLLLGHFLLFMMTPPILVPYIDRLHATLLCEFISIRPRSEFLKACQFGSDHQNKSAHLSILSNKRSSVAGL